MVKGPELVTLAAGTALGRARDGGALHWVLRHPASIGHRSPRARMGLLQAFGPKALPILLRALERGLPDPGMERAIIDMLAEGGATGAADTIAARLGHEWRDVRVAAARALGRLESVPHAGHLVAALADTEWQVRAQAARALGRLGAVEAIPALAPLLRDPAWWTRRHAAYALAALGDAGLARLREAATSDPDRYARDIAAEALAGGFPLPRT
jgi:HEAT repeat protein